MESVTGQAGALCVFKGKPETKVFAWATGIGNSTGAGFGSIY